MFKPYYYLSYQERLKRSIWTAVFSFFLIIALFAFPKFSLETTILFSLVLIVLSAYQIQKDYKKMIEEKASKKT